MKSLRRQLGGLSVAAMLICIGTADAQNMPVPPRAPQRPVAPQYSMPMQNPAQNPAATGYSYGQPAYRPTRAVAARPARPMRQRPVTRVAQAYGANIPQYAPRTAQAPAGYTPVTATTAPTVQAAAALPPATPQYSTIAPTNPMPAINAAMPQAGMHAMQGQVQAMATQAVQPISQPMGMGPVTTGVTGMPMDQSMAPMNQPMAPMNQPIMHQPMDMGMAPASHAVVDGAGCGGGYDPGFVGDGMMEGGMIGGDMGYIGGDCGTSYAEPTPVYAPSIAAAPSWFGGFYGLIMNRDDGNDVCFLTEPSALNNLFLKSSDAAMEFSAGYEVRLGRVFNEGSWGMEFVYWELFPDDQTASVNANQVNAGQLYTTTDYRDVHLNFNGHPTFPARDSIANTFSETGNIVAARLRRSFAFQNIELNLLSGPLCGGGGFRAGSATPFGQGYAGLVGDGGCYGGSCYGPAVGGGGCGDACSPCGDLYANPCGTGGCGPRLNVGWLFGLRYFKFDESLILDYDIADNVYDGNANNEFQHGIRVENDLVGAQLGLNLNYALTDCLSFDAGTKFGLFGNHIGHRQFIQNGNDYAYVQGGGVEENIDITEDKEDVAFLGELRMGAAYKIGCHWRLSGGYRVLALSGVGLATNQLPYARSYTDLRKVGDIDRNGSLILHGAYAGVEFCW